MRELATSPLSAALYDADILPLVNPWGWVHGVGASPNGVDIEWDFASFDTHESRIVRRFLREKRYDLVIDLREDPEATGFYIWQYGLDATATSERIVGDLRAKGHPIEADVRRLLLKPRNGIIAAPMWGLTLMRLFDQLTLSGYIRQNTSYVVFFGGHADHTAARRTHRHAAHRRGDAHFGIPDHTRVAATGAARLVRSTRHAES